MAKILNVGSLNIDHVYSVEHFVTPGETLASTGYEVFPGGKGLNQSIALARGGGTVAHAGKIGPDGAWLKALLDENGVDTALLRQDGTHTGHAIIQVSRSGQNCILLYGGANREITPAQVEQALAGYGRGDLLVLQNEVNLLGELVDVAHARGVQIALNPSPMEESILALPLEKITWFLLNEVEARAITGETNAEQMLEALLQRYPHGRIVLTLGKQGVRYRDAAQEHHHGIYNVSVADTTAAGDTFTGFFLAAVMRGEAIPEALRLASVASSIAVSRKGAAVSIPTLEEVLASDLKPL